MPHFTNGFSMQIQIRWKFRFTLTSILLQWSLQNLVHVTTATEIQQRKYSYGKVKFPSNFHRGQKSLVKWIWPWYKTNVSIYVLVYRTTEPPAIRKLHVHVTMRDQLKASNYLAGFMVSLQPTPKSFKAEIAWMSHMTRQFFCTRRSWRHKKAITMNCYCRILIDLS